MQRRRKKRGPNWRGTRNVEVERGAAGSFGITISGQKPCILSSIAENSPAHLAGLRAGDFLISINGLNVSKLQHEIIVQLINNANPKIWMSIAENFYKSDSSDDDTPHTPGGGGRSYSGELAQRMRPKYSGNKLKAFRHIPQQPQLPNANNYEMLMPSNRQFCTGRDDYQYHHSNNYSGPGSSASGFDHSMPYNPTPANKYYGASGSHHDGFKENSVLIDSRECVPSLEYKIIVGYLGTIEMPGQLTGPRLQIVRQCIKKMRQEKRQPLAVLMTILPHCMTLRNANNQVLATYAAGRMSFVSNGSQSETERNQTNFGLITTAYYNTNGVMVSPSRAASSISSDAVVSNSCHVFMVNQKIVDHRVHFEKLSLFKIRCTRDPISNLCLEFPKDTDYVVNLIRSMYTLNTNEEQLLRVARNRAAAMDDRNELAAMSNSPQPSNHSELTTTSSNSDSGIGFHNDCTNICDRILVVDFPGLRLPANNHYGWPNASPANQRPSGISTERDLCPIEGTQGNVSIHAESTESEHFARRLPSLDFSTQDTSSESKLTVRAMPFPRISNERPVVSTISASDTYEERAVDVQVSSPGFENAQSRDDFVFRAPALPVPSSSNIKSAKQRFNFFASKLSPKVFGTDRIPPTSQSCDNLSTNGQRSATRRPLTEELDKCAEDSRGDDEYIDIWGSVSEVDAQECRKLYSEINAQRQTFLNGASSEPNINAMAKPLPEDLIENCDNYSRLPTTAKNSPFRRYGQLSSSFRSQLTATETKKMLTGGSSGTGQANKFPARPRSFATSDDDVYHKSEKPVQPVVKSVGSNVEARKRTPVLEWNTSFEILLSDIYGVHAFAEFLRKEFSAENIYFWTACERYKQLECAAERCAEAQRIFSKHLENGAPDPVNIDSQATSKTQAQLKEANVDLFDAAQKQIFNLMKYDSYARFIKSDIYKNCLERDIKKLTPPYPENRVLDPALSSTNQELQGQGTSVSPIKLKKSLSNAEDRRRKSLLPWHRKTRSKSKDRNEDKKEGDANGNNIYSSRSSLSSFDAVLESKDSQRSQLCRVILPNGATTIVQTRPTETIRELVVRLLDKRGLAYTCFEVITGDSNKPCDLECMSTRIAGKQVTIEQRVTFKLDLPNKKVISVKSKPEKVLEEVLRPILHKYHYSLDEVQVHVRDTPPNQPMPVPLIKKIVTEVDGRRLTIIMDNDKPVTCTLHEVITSRVFPEVMPEHPYGGVQSVKKFADYMNCRFAGQQMVQGPISERPTPAPRLSIAKSPLQTSINNSQDSGILSNRSIGSTSSQGDHSRQENNIDSDHAHETYNLKSPPPPLPPKPKVLPIRGPNWGGQKNIYLDQPTSSFV